MPDILCYCADKEILQGVEALCNANDLRFKSTLEYSSAIEWLKLKSFDCLVIDPNITEAERSKLSEKLWQQDPASAVYVYDPKGQLGDLSAEYVIEGLMPLSAGNAKERLNRIFQTLKKGGERTSGQFRVLVVEDLDSPRDIICSYIEGFGYGTVDGVSSANEALTVLTADPAKYSCIVTDIRMPNMTGKELIEQVRLHPKLQMLPIIVLTAYGTADTLVDCLKAGASGFLVKPPKRNDLMRELGRAMRIIQNQESPRLTGQEEADLLRKILLDRGI